VTSASSAAPRAVSAAARASKGVRSDSMGIVGAAVEKKHRGPLKVARNTAYKKNGGIFAAVQCARAKRLAF